MIPEKYNRARKKISEILEQKLHDRNYGDAIDWIFLAPMILQKDVPFFERRKERKLIKHKKRLADLRLRIDYLKFVSTDDKTREKLLLKNVIDAVRIIQNRLKKNFDGEELEKDILSLWNLKYSDLECL